jgi:hypothetical protein
MKKIALLALAGTALIAAPTLGFAQTSDGRGGPTPMGSNSDLKSKSTIQGPEDDQQGVVNGGPQAKTPPQTQLGNEPRSTTPMR